MVEENNIRLIALIEAINYGSNFKILNFLPGFKVKRIVESGIHKQDIEGRYCFAIEKEDVFQIPYGSNLKDISVIVGENGTGKTTIINKMLRGNSNTYLILEKNNEFYIYSTSRQDNISLQYLDETLEINYFYNNAYIKRPYIIKFSNAEEFNDGNIYIAPDAVDASRFKNIHGFNLNLGINDNKKDIYLWETMNQIRFVEEYKHKVSEFVDYTNKGVTVEFNSDGVPFQSQQLVYLDKFKNYNRNDSEKKIVNFRLICYFSVLINYIIEIFYSKDSTPNIERLLEFHLSRYEDKDNLSLQYQSISVDSDRFLPTKYNIGGLRAVVPTSLMDCCEDKNWIKLWHLYFILHLYIKLIRTNEEDITEKYAERIRLVLQDLYNTTEKIELMSKFDIEESRDKGELIDKIKNYNDDISNVVYCKTSGQDSENFWDMFKAPSTLVAKSLSYTHYFELKESGYFVKHKLLPEMVWDDLENLISEKIELLQEIADQLYELSEISTDFKPLSIIIDNISKVNIPAVTNSLQMKWMGLSSGELGLLKSFSNLDYAKKILQKNENARVDNNNFLLLLDEVDLGLHPEWQRKWVHSALPIIEKIFENQHLQLIITSHSPILLSDIYKENVIFLTKDNGVSINQEFEKTFGQNIYTLYKSSFFLNKLMGEYAYKTIEDTVEYLSAQISEKTLGKGNLYYELEENKKILTAKKIIDSVGDIIIANQLKELFERAFPTLDEESDLTKIAQLKNQINKLQQELEELERDERK